MDNVLFAIVNVIVAMAMANGSTIPFSLEGAGPLTAPDLERRSADRMWMTFSALPETCISEDAWIVRWSQTQAPLPGQEGELMFDRSQIVGRGRPE